MIMVIKQFRSNQMIPIHGKLVIVSVAYTILCAVQK